MHDNELGQIMIMNELMNQANTPFAGLTCNYYMSHKSDDEFTKPNLISTPNMLINY